MTLYETIKFRISINPFDLILHEIKFHRTLGEGL